MLALTIDVCDAATCALLHEGVAGSEKEVVRKLFLAAHELLQKGIDNFPLNGTYLAKFVDRLQEALLEPVCCSEGAPQQTLLTMLRNNQTVVERLPDEQKEFFLRHVHDSADDRAHCLRYAPIYVSSYYYIRVLILLYICPHTTIYDSLEVRVLILLYICPHTTIYDSSEVRTHHLRYAPA